MSPSCEAAGVACVAARVHGTPYFLLAWAGSAPIHHSVFGHPCSHLESSVGRESRITKNHTAFTDFSLGCRVRGYKPGAENPGTRSPMEHPQRNKTHKNKNANVHRRTKQTRTGTITRDSQLSSFVQPALLSKSACHAQSFFFSGVGGGGAAGRSS